MRPLRVFHSPCLQYQNDTIWIKSQRNFRQVANSENAAASIHPVQKCAHTTELFRFEYLNALQNDICVTLNILKLCVCELRELRIIRRCGAIFHMYGYVPVRVCVQPYVERGGLT